MVKSKKARVTIVRVSGVIVGLLSTFCRQTWPCFAKIQDPILPIPQTYEKDEQHIMRFK